MCTIKGISNSQTILWAATLTDTDQGSHPRSKDSRYHVFLRVEASGLLQREHQLLLRRQHTNQRPRRHPRQPGDHQRQQASH